MWSKSEILPTEVGSIDGLNASPKRQVWVSLPIVFLSPTACLALVWSSLPSPKLLFTKKKKKQKWDFQNFKQIKINWIWLASILRTFVNELFFKKNWYHFYGIKNCQKSQLFFSFLFTKSYVKVYIIYICIFIIFLINFIQHLCILWYIIHKRVKYHFRP